MPSRRIERINDLIRSEISDLIAKELKDPRITGMISVTEVDTSPDMRHAKVFVSIMGSEEERKTVMNTLKHAAGFFRRELGERMTTRRTPELAFELDTSIERGDRIMRLLRDIQQDQNA
ncbi:MAG: 30S ribosome-binding factor RbfA [Dehalococcoidales bacterium]|nr:30S ribosome-binding factor RbfA [Dehalococcoidales bacterium]